MRCRPMPDPTVLWLLPKRHPTRDAQHERMGVSLKNRTTFWRKSFTRATHFLSAAWWRTQPPAPPRPPLAAISGRPNSFQRQPPCASVRAKQWAVQAGSRWRFQRPAALL